MKTVTITAAFALTAVTLGLYSTQGAPDAQVVAEAAGVRTEHVTTPQLWLPRTQSGSIDWMEIPMPVRGQLWNRRFEMGELISAGVSDDIIVQDLSDYQLETEGDGND